jgi:hypothetical protein
MLHIRYAANGMQVQDPNCSAQALVRPTIFSLRGVVPHEGSRSNPCLASPPSVRVVVRFRERFPLAAKKHGLEPLISVDSWSGNGNSFVGCNPMMSTQSIQRRRNQTTSGRSGLAMPSILIFSKDLPAILYISALRYRMPDGLPHSTLDFADITPSPPFSTASFERIESSQPLASASAHMASTRVRAGGYTSSAGLPYEYNPTSCSTTLSG